MEPCHFSPSKKKLFIIDILNWKIHGQSVGWWCGRWPLVSAERQCSEPQSLASLRHSYCIQTLSGNCTVGLKRWPVVTTTVWGRVGLWRADIIIHLIILPFRLLFFVCEVPSFSSSHPPIIPLSYIVWCVERADGGPEGRFVCRTVGVGLSAGASRKATESEGNSADRQSANFPSNSNARLNGLSGDTQIALTELYRSVCGCFCFLGVGWFFVFLLGMYLYSWFFF